MRLGRACCLLVGMRFRREPFSDNVQRCCVGVPGRIVAGREGLSAFQDDDNLRVIKVMESEGIERSRQSHERVQRRGAGILRTSTSANVCVRLRPFFRHTAKLAVAPI